MKITSKSFAQKFELKWSLGGPLSKLCVTPPFPINFRCQIENQASDYRLMGASSFIIGCEKTIMMMYRLLLFTVGLKLNHKKCGCVPSSVIKIVKMKYNRIDIKIYYTLTFFYITYTIFYYNIFHSGVYFVLFQLKAFIKQNHTVYLLVRI